MENGYFFTIEGGDGSGKTSIVKKIQSKKFKNRIKDLSFKFVNDPGSFTKELKSIRGILLSSDFDFSDETELLLYAASRAELVERHIKPYLEKGVSVISDRFFDSTFVYQGILKGHDFSKLSLLNTFFCGGLVPDTTFLCDVDPKIGLSRSIERLEENSIDESRWESMGLEVHTRINNGFKEIAKRSPERFVIIDSNNATIESMTEEIISYIENNFTF